MKQYDIRPVKSLGQNFLVNSHVKKIIEAADIQKDDLIIEIGAGLGVLSKEIANKAGRFAAIEIDRNLIPILEEVLKDYKNTKIINKDILKLDIKNDVICRIINEGEGFVPTCIKVVGNLPYYITTPIMMKLLEDDTGIDEIIFMIQKKLLTELWQNRAQRIMALYLWQFNIIHILIYYLMSHLLLFYPDQGFIHQLLD